MNGVAVTSGSPSAALPLIVGANTVTVVVTAQDTTTTKTYTITVTRAVPSTDATLSALSISSGTLTPEFASATIAYTDSVANAVASVTVTPTVTESHATITVNGVAVTSGSPSAALPLIVGDNTVTVVVTAQDATTTKTYTITVTRAAPPALSITNNSLPNGYVGLAYTTGLAATGGTEPYSWTIAAPAGSTLPAWLQVTHSGNWYLTGTPTAVGTFNVVVTVTDSLTFTASRTLPLAVVTGRAGGPDSFGYTYIDSNAPGGPIYNWYEITSSGTSVLPNSDDNYVANIPLGFHFNYYGTDYSQVSFSNNGIVFSGAPTGQYSNQPIMQSTAHGFVAPFWDDLVTYNTATAKICYQTLGIAPNRTFVVEWYDNQHYSSSPNGVTFEAILYEGSDNILFQYQDVFFGDGNDRGTSATVGIESPAGNVGLQYSYNQAWLSNGLAILFQFRAFSGTNLYLSKSAPISMDHGNDMTYMLNYNNFGDNPAAAVILEDTLPAEVTFVSAPVTNNLDGSPNPGTAGTYDATTRKVTWNIGSVPAYPHGSGYRKVVVHIPDAVAIGTVLVNNALISTTTFETRIDDNAASASSRVTGSGLPTGVSVGGIIGNSGGTPILYWQNPTVFNYHSCPTATAVHITIHFNEGGTDIQADMTGGPPDWTYTAAPFYPRHGTIVVTYTVTGCIQATVSFNIYVDPAGYVYNIVTGARLPGATVTLQWPDGSGGWANVPTGASPATMDPDTNPLTTSASGDYAWMTLAGTYRTHVTLAGYYAQDSRVVTVPPPVTDLHVGMTPLMSIGPASLTDALIGVLYSQTISVTAGGVAPYSWSTSAGTLPLWATLNATTGVLSGTPSTAGTAVFTVRVMDSTGHTQDKAYSMAWYAGLAITATALPDGTNGTAYTTTLSANGGATPYIWSVTTGSLPAWATLNTATGAITGTPNATGSTSFTVQAADSSVPALIQTKALSITIYEPLVITNASLSDGTIGSAYTTTLTATGGAPTHTWSITAGSLPTGLTLVSATGVISGTPTAALISNFTVQVTDSAVPALLQTKALSIFIRGVSTGGGNSGPGTRTTATSGFAYSSPLIIDQSGIARSAYQIHTPDGVVTIDIPAGTKLLDAQGNAMPSFNIVQFASPPTPPTGAAVVLPYLFGPEGATFSPALTITIKFDPAKLPANVAAGDLYFAYFNGTTWQNLGGTVDTTTNTVTAQITHFSTYAVMGTMKAPAPAPILPPVTVTPAPTAVVTPTPTAAPSPTPVVVAPPVTTTAPPASQPAVIGTITPPAATTQPAPQQNTQSNNSGWIIGVIVVVVVVVLAGFLIMRNRKKPGMKD